MIIFDTTGARPAAAPGVSAPGRAYVREKPWVAREALSTLIERRRPQFSPVLPRRATRELETDLALPSGPFAAPTFKRFYEPDSLRVMTDALDFACRMLPPTVRDSHSLRRRLALHIIHEVDGGERDPARLATTAVLSVRI
jgi:hypothetical protein